MAITSHRALLLVTASVSVAACAPGDAEVSTEEAEHTSYRLDVKPGDPIVQDEITVIAPEAGIGVYAEVLLDTGSSRTLHVKTDIDSVVYLLPEEHDDGEDGGEEITVHAEEAGEAPVGGAQKPCSDSGKNLLPYKVSGALEWYFNAGSTPAGNSVANVEEKLKRAATNITRSRNSCGLADQVGATQIYKGKTSAGAQINGNATCKANGNGKNTVGFGDLPDGTLGLACVFYDQNGHVVEADIRLNKTENKWYAQKPSGCSGRFSVEAVATHEFGHVFGLGHVGEGAHGNLTMSPQINGACQGSESTLGRGDVLGLRAKY